MNTMAVAARTPSPSDGRLPCPHCGGLVHPIAGRCRHCKVDLAAQRTTRPAAAAALPALAGDGNARRDTPVMGIPNAPEPAPSPIKALLKAQEASDPVLPQRPNHSGRMPAAGGRSIFRNWPVMVIILAGIAIAAAVVIMVWPASKTAKADSHLTPPPAPERMDTNPLPPQGSITPTPTPPKAGTQNGGGGPDPWANPKNDQTNIDPPDPSQDPMNPNNGGGLGGNPFGGGSGTGNTMTVVMMKHLCNRMSNCGNAMLGQACQLFDQMTGPVTAPSCAAAQRCVDHLDQLDCNTASMSSMADATNLFQATQDCADALTRC